MKILVIHASAGSGHKKIAEAIAEIGADLKGSEFIKVVDVLDYTSHISKFLYSKGYIFLISKMKWLWGVFFYFADTPYLRFFNVTCRQVINKLVFTKFLRFLENERPEVVISTHFLVNELVSRYKDKNELKTKLLSVVTDFGVHNFWIAENVDIYCVASVKTKKILISKGVPNSKIEVLGIPVRKQFERQLDANEIKNRLGISPGKFIVLILTGGIGIGPIDRVVNELKGHANIVVICGKNKKLYNQLKAFSSEGVYPLGWVDAIEEIMKISDLVVTKPGGSTVSECLHLCLPMIFFSIIPGQEKTNATILSNYGCGLILQKPRAIKNKILGFIDNPLELQVMRDRIEKFRYVDSGSSIFQLISK